MGKHSPSLPRNAEYTSEEGARELVKTIEKSWCDRGFPTVRAWAHCLDGYWSIRSNLVNGMPPAIETSSALKKAA